MRYVSGKHPLPPLVSVIMPAYNHEAFVGEAIESILRQTCKEFELIIANDGSTDGSMSVIQEYAGRDQRIRPAFFPHRGIPITLNSATAMAKGSYIAYADTDDFSFPDRLRQQLQWISDKGVDICGSQADVFGADNDMAAWHGGINWLPESHEAVRREMLFRVAVWRGAAMIKTEVCKDNPFDESIRFVDCDWPMRMAMKYKMGNAPSVLIRIRRHSDNATLLNKPDFMKEMRKSRFKYFYHCFPKTPLADYVAFSHVADRLPMTSLWELERAGRWLVQFASYPDRQLQQKMGKRWKEACERSASLGDEVEDVFRRYHRKIEDGSSRRSLEI